MAERHELQWDGLLGDVYAAAHRALVRLADEEVPAGLKQVAAASVKRSLPPPHRRTLRSHLEHEWLRELALAEVAGRDDEVARLFLTRPDGWKERLDELDADRAKDHDRHTSLALQAEIERVRRVNEDLTERVRQAEARADEAERRGNGAERADALKRRLDEMGKVVEGLQVERAAARAAIERLEHELGEADDRINTLRTRGAKKGATADVRPSGWTFGRGNPIETARLLDELSEALRPGPPSTPPSTGSAPLGLPAGVRPDRPEAIDWIVTIERRVTLIVDGHNVAHDLAAEPGRSARDRVVTEAARLRRLAEGPLAVVVYFDTDQEPEAHKNFGVSVRYVPDADAAIVALSAESDHATIVISTDKDVRERSAANGAIALWGTAFSSWMRRR